jgi:hypothetical protein
LDTPSGENATARLLVVLARVVTREQQYEASDGRGAAHARSYPTDGAQRLNAVDMFSRALQAGRAWGANLQMPNGTVAVPFDFSRLETQKFRASDLLIFL